MLVTATYRIAENIIDMEILNLIAKVSWDTNTKALEKMNADLKHQDVMLDELRRKGQRLNDQLIKTNDPKKVKNLNDELQKTKKSVDAIVEAQKKQVSTLDSLNKKQADLVSKLQKTNDPQLVQGLLRNLRQVENQMSVLDKQATTLPSKIGGIGKQLLEGLGVGAGMFGLQAGMQAISGFIGGAIEEFEDAQKTSLDLDRALKVIGKSKYFEGLKKEADSLAVSFHGLFDNDEIIKAQTALVQYGKLSREEMSKLLPIIMNLASAEGIDLANATEKVVNILEGRGGQTLRDYGVTVKGVKTEHDRLNVVLGDFQTKLSGAADTYATTAQGIEQTNRVLLSNIEENFGESFSKLKRKVLPLVTDILDAVNKVFQTQADINDELQGGASNTVNTLLNKKGGFNSIIQGALSNPETLALAYNKLTKSVDLYKKAIAATETERAKSTISASKAIELDNRLIRLNEEYAIRRGALEQLTLFRNGKANVDSGAINPNAKTASDEETKKVVKAKVKTAQSEADKKENELRLQAKIYLGKLKPGQSDTGDIKGEVERLNKEIEDARKKGLANQEIAFESDAKREAILGVTSTSDVEADKLNQELLTQQKEKGEKARTEIAKKEADERKKIEREELFQSTVYLAGELSNLYSTEIRAIDRLISAQEKRVEAAKNSSEKSLAIEQNRLDELTRKRDKYERQQRTIDAAVIVANQAVAISGAVKTIASGGNPILIAANVLAILAGITASVSAIRSINAGAGFKEGGYTGDGDPSEVSTSLGNRGYKYHKKEFVMNEHLTSKHRDMLEGMHRGELVVNKLNDGYYLTNRTIDTEKAISDYYSVKNNVDMRGMEGLLHSIDQRLTQREVNVKIVNNDEGMAANIAYHMGRANLIKKLRN